MKDRQRALRFWRDLLGLEVIPAQEDGEGLIWMQAEDGTMIHLVQQQPDSGPNVHTAFEVEDFDGALGRMKDAGFEIIKGPIERADGQKAFYVYDPDGNLVGNFEFEEPVLDLSSELQTSGKTKTQRRKSDVNRLIDKAASPALMAYFMKKYERFRM